jgi:hypothetical protein
MTTTIARLLYEQESARVQTLLDENYYGIGYRILHGYRAKLRHLFLWNEPQRLTNYQLWKLRQEVFRHLNTQQIGETQMETTIPCHQCEADTEPDEAIILEDEAYCEDCVDTCENCECSAVRSDMHSDDYTLLCNSCYENNYITCEECDHFVHSDSYINVQDTYLCQSCYDDGAYHHCDAADEARHGHEDDCEDCNGRRRSGELLHHYGYKPDPLFHDTRTSLYRHELKGCRYFGVELETTPRRGNDCYEAAEYINENISDELLYLKEDSSISDGFEIVTHPMTLHWARNNFPWEMLTKISELNMHAWNDSRCGLHIHINRESFRSQSHLAKLLLFVYRNEREMVSFTGRHSHNYADYSESERNNFVSRAKGNRYGARGVAVNCQNQHTIELRVFRPSLLPSTVQAYIEFCDALVVYAGTITVEDCVKRNALSFGTFAEWLTTQTDEDYSVLNARIQKRVYAVETV